MKKAFTLAEVLIGLGILGVVSAITIPTLISNYQERAWNTASQVFERKLEEALKVMNTQQTLAGYKNTFDFINELSKHMKISKICTNDDLVSCFEEKVYWGTDAKEVEMTDIKKAKNFGQDDWDTETVAVQFANGTTGVIAYNPDCKQDPYSNQIKGTNCLAILYDTDGYKNPNTSSKDLRSINVPNLGSDCAAKINGKCFSQVQTLSGMSKSECLAIVNSGKYGNKFNSNECSNCDNSFGKNNCYHMNAVETCGGIDNLPSVADFEALSNILYTSGSIDKTLCTELNFSCSTWTSGLGYLDLWVSNTNGGAGRYVTFNFKQLRGPYDPSSSSSDAKHAICIID